MEDSKTEAEPLSTPSTSASKTDAELLLEQPFSRPSTSTTKTEAELLQQQPLSPLRPSNSRRDAELRQRQPLSPLRPSNSRRNAELQQQPLPPLRPFISRRDAELLQQHGITKNCRVCLSRLARFLISSARQIPEDEFSFYQQRLLAKDFRVHYGRHFLEQIADYAYRSAPDYTSVDFDQLYSTYITSRFSALDRVRFKSIVQSYHAQWQNDFNRRRADLIAKKVAEVNAKKKAALKRRKIYYKGSCIIVSDGISEEAKKALQNGRRYKVILKRICIDSQQSCISEDQLSQSAISDERPSHSAISEEQPSHSAISEEQPSHSAISEEQPLLNGVCEENLSQNGIGEEHLSQNGIYEEHLPQSCICEEHLPQNSIPKEHSSQNCVSEEQPSPESNGVSHWSSGLGFHLSDNSEEDPRTVTHKLIRDLIEKTSQDLESSGYCDFIGEEDEDEDDDYVAQDNTESDDQATDISDDTIESPMEEDFVSGESPYFTKGLQNSPQDEFNDSEETRHCSEFVTQSRSSYTCDTDQSNSGLPTENGQDSDGKHDMNNSSDDAEGTSCAIKQAIRNQNKAIVVVPVKLCN